GHWPTVRRLFSSISMMTTGRSKASRGCSTWNRSKTRTRSSWSGSGSTTRSAASATSNMRASTRASPKIRALRESHVIGDRPSVGEEASSSFFPERPHELILQGLGQIGQNRTLAGLDESLDRHAGNELHIAEPCDFTFRHGDAGRVIALTRALVRRGVGGYPGDGAVDFGSRAQVE